jgi:hypothetical protein
MVWRSFYFLGLKIEIGDPPFCLMENEWDNWEDCDSCENSLIRCPLEDRDCRNVARIILEQKKSYYEYNSEELDLLFRIIYAELLHHGRPLHYTVIQKMIVTKFPEYTNNEKLIYQVLLSYKEKIERVNEG